MLANAYCVCVFFYIRYFWFGEFFVVHPPHPSSQSPILKNEKRGADRCGRLWGAQINNFVEGEIDTALPIVSGP